MLISLLPQVVNRLVYRKKGKKWGNCINMYFYPSYFQIPDWHWKERLAKTIAVWTQNFLMIKSGNQNLSTFNLIIISFNQAFICIIFILQIMEWWWKFTLFYKYLPIWECVRLSVCPFVRETGNIYRGGESERFLSAIE